MRRDWRSRICFSLSAFNVAARHSRAARHAPALWDRGSRRDPMSLP